MTKKEKTDLARLIRGAAETAISYYQTGNEKEGDTYLTEAVKNAARVPKEVLTEPIDPDSQGPG